MPQGRRDVETESIASLTSSKLLRRRKRAEVLRRIIYLKRRTIRCYFVNVFVAFIQLVIHSDVIYDHWPLMQKHLGFLLYRLLFVVSLILTLVGSVVSINALSKKTKKLAFFNGNLLICMGATINSILILNMFIHILPRNPKFYYGYPKNIVEDCEAYPDHVFKFFLKPESLKDRPIIVDVTKVRAAGHDADDVDEDDVTTPDGTEKGEREVTEEYDCAEMLDNIKFFKVTSYFVIGMFLITSVTFILSVVGIVHLWLIHLKGLNYSILPPALVEPYEFYDDLMLHNHSVESIPGLNAKGPERLELKV